MSALSSTSGPSRAIDRPLTVLALILVATVTESMFMILPSFVGALGDVLHLSPRRLGLLGSADLAGIAVSTATAAWWLRRVSWRRSIALNLGTFLVVNVLCIGVRSFDALMILRLVAGASAGAAYVVALAGLIDTRKVDRNTGLMVCSQVVLAALGVYATDVVPIAWRLDAVYIFILAWLVPTLLVCWRHFPQNPGDRPAAAAIDWRRLAGPGTAAVLGCCLYFLMIGAVWGYLEGVARAAGLSLEQTGEALSLGLVVSLLGSAAATLMGVKFGRAGPLIVTGVFQAGSLYLLTKLGGFASPVLAFYVINAVFQVFWSYVIAYFIIIFNDIDPSGRFVAFYGTASHLTLAVGPYVGAILIAAGSYVPLLWFGVITVVLCYVSFLTAVGATRTAPEAAEVRV